MLYFSLPSEIECRAKWLCRFSFHSFHIKSKCFLRLYVIVFTPNIAVTYHIDEVEPDPVIFWIRLRIHLVQLVDPEIIFM